MVVNIVGYDDLLNGNTLAEDIKHIANNLSENLLEDHFPGKGSDLKERWDTYTSGIKTLKKRTIEGIIISYSHDTLELTLPNDIEEIINFILDIINERQREINAPALAAKARMKIEKNKISDKLNEIHKGKLTRFSGYLYQRSIDSNIRLSPIEEKEIENNNPGKTQDIIEEVKQRAIKGKILKLFNKFFKKIIKGSFTEENFIELMHSGDNKSIIRKCYEVIDKERPGGRNPKKVEEYLEAILLVIGSLRGDPLDWEAGSIIEDYEEHTLARLEGLKEELRGKLTVANNEFEVFKTTTINTFKNDYGIIEGNITPNEDELEKIIQDDLVIELGNPLGTKLSQELLMEFKKLRRKVRTLENLLK